MSESASYDDRALKYANSTDGNRLERSIERKRTYTSSFNPKDLEELTTFCSANKLFEHVIIVGAPPDGDSLDPRILFLAPAYPLLFQEEEFNQTIQFCFPNGLHPHGREYSRSTMFLTQFAFRLSGQNDIYGVCCHLVINPRRVPFFASEKTLGYPFCFCILTRFPVLSVHFQYLTYLSLLFNRVVNPSERPAALSTYSSASKSGELVDASNSKSNTASQNNETSNSSPHQLVYSGSGMEVVEAAGESLSYLTVEKNTARWPDTRFPDLFTSELLFFGTFTADPNRDKKISLSENILLVVPHTAPDNVYIAMPSLDVLFSCLSVSDIVKLYTALLLEHHTIFKSKKLQKITMAVLAARSILAPFKVEATLLPIVPNNSSFLPLLESPVPYICGLVSTSAALSSITLPEQLCLVDLDKKTVIDQELHVNVPKHLELIEKLNRAIREDEEMITVPPKFLPGKTSHGKPIPNPDFATFFEQTSPYMRPAQYLKTRPPKYVFIPPLVERILHTFSSHFAPELESKIKACFVTDSTDLSHPITVFNKDLFLASVDPQQEEFYEAFINTTMFQQYCEGKTDEMQNVKAMMSDSYVTNLDLMSSC
ncbi:hypothetical protein TRFO_17111 [Tritrichomonas foetus]|uniref:UDENN domain-containing protein n=1 Tax=Tritrichomonas foetus TaxID=1144522 RepID=A0A1J4KP20_9EUKA|nr:hypothetical protein TRFO_17111 [Tritrichomonas foetus]|eukprot:OHT12858.1 hypothetical protein TRFO_17111 [Tritrichomonas foetus]